MAPEIEQPNNASVSPGPGLEPGHHTAAKSRPRTSLQGGPSIAFETSRLIRAVAEYAREGVAILAVEPVEQLRVVWANNAFLRTTGLTPAEIVGQRIASIPGSLLEPGSIGRIFDGIRDGQEYVEDVLIRNPVRGTLTSIEATLSAMPDPRGFVRHLVLTYRDISRRTHASASAPNDPVPPALHDALTGFASRALFVDRLAHAITRSRRTGQRPAAVLLLDCDRFKLVNDSFGHAIGDQLLIAIAHRLETFLRSSDTLARLGGDEFSILLDDCTGEGAVLVAQRIIDGLARPFRLTGHQIFATVSIGIASSVVGYAGPEDVMRDADIAMYRAKACGKNRYVVFEAAHRLASIRVLQLETDLRQAVECGEMSVYYQPIFSVELERVISFEALLRWTHPALGMVSPVEFIPIAEEAGLIVPLGTWVLFEACRQVREWQLQHANHSQAEISVNVSAKQLTDVNFEQVVLQALAQSGLDPEHLHLEITESTLMNDPEGITALLRELRSRGIKIHIDDFGTGYSSLAYLHQFAIDTLKIDKSFVSGVGMGLANREIVKTIIALAQQLNLEVIAEGVETPEQASELHDLKCTSTQGYLHARALAPDAMSVYLKTTENDVSEVSSSRTTPDMSVSDDGCSTG